jgi:hypothetical protein
MAQELIDTIVLVILVDIRWRYSSLPVWATDSCMHARTHMWIKPCPTKSQQCRWWVHASGHEHMDGHTQFYMLGEVDLELHQPAALDHSMFGMNGDCTTKKVTITSILSAGPVTSSYDCKGRDIRYASKMMLHSFHFKVQTHPEVLLGDSCVPKGGRLTLLGNTDSEIWGCFFCEQFHTSSISEDWNRLKLFRLWINLGDCLPIYSKNLVKQIRIHNFREWNKPST